MRRTFLRHHVAKTSSLKCKPLVIGCCPRPAPDDSLVEGDMRTREEGRRKNALSESFSGFLTRSLRRTKPNVHVPTLGKASHELGQNNYHKDLNSFLSVLLSKPRSFQPYALPYAARCLEVGHDFHALSLCPSSYVLSTPLGKGASPSSLFRTKVTCDDNLFHETIQSADCPTRMDTAIIKKSLTRTQTCISLHLKSPAPPNFLKTPTNETEMNPPQAHTACSRYDYSIIHSSFRER